MLQYLFVKGAMYIDLKRKYRQFIDIVNQLINETGMALNASSMCEASDAGLWCFLWSAPD